MKYQLFEYVLLLFVLVALTLSYQSLCLIQLFKPFARLLKQKAKY